MTKYIDADLLRMELEKRLKNVRDYMNGAGMRYKGPKFYKARGKESAYDAFLNIIDSLQQEQPDFPTTDEQVKEFLATHPKTEVPEKYKSPDWLFKNQEQPEVDLEKEMDKFYGMYRDDNGETYDVEDNEPCFDWKEDELAEHELHIARHFYELGLNARKEK